MTQNSRRIKTEYIFAQSFYWMMYCSLCGFAAIFMEMRGFSAGKIGVILAVANVLNVILQPVMAGAVDKAGVFLLKPIMIILGICTGGALLVLRNPMIPDWSAAVLILVTNTAVVMTQPFLNSICVFFQNHGVEINFGVARGIGSVMYAAVSFLLGILLKKQGENSILSVGLIVCIGFLICILGFQINEKTGNVKKEERKVNIGALEFLRRYWNYFKVLFGFALVFTEHFIMNTFLVQIVKNVGGTAGDAGVASGIAAALELPAMFLFAAFVRKAGSGGLLKIAAMMFTVKGTLFLLADSVMMIFAAQCLQMLSFGLYTPAVVWYTNEKIEKEDMVKGQSMAVLAAVVGNVGGNVIGGWLCEWLGVRQMLACGLVICITGTCIILYWADNRRKERMEYGT